MKDQPNIISQKTHWDNLRNDCKDCLKNYRKNTKKIQNTNTKYEKTKTK